MGCGNFLFLKETEAYLGQQPHGMLARGLKNMVESSIIDVPVSPMTPWQIGATDAWVRVIYREQTGEATSRMPKTQIAARENK